MITPSDSGPDARRPTGSAADAFGIDVQRRRFLQAGMLAIASGAMAGRRLLSRAFGSTRLSGSAASPLFGASISRPMLSSTAVAELVPRVCRIMNLGGALYWHTAHRNPDQFDFADADFLLAYADAHGILARGHTLVWHEGLPAWVQGALDRDPTALLDEHISTMVTHLRGRLHSWDVVNEVIATENGRADGLRNTPWLRALGPGYIGQAFRAARAADDRVLLGYNEYGLEPDGAFADRKRAAVLKLLSGLRTQDVPIDYLGIQGHLDGSQRYSSNSFGSFLKDVRSLGLRVLITELDVDDRAFPSDAALRDRAVADTYSRFLSVALDAVPVDAVLTWGLLDRDSWYQHIRPREDHVPQRPLPFDDEGRPKAAWFAIRQVLGLP